MDPFGLATLYLPEQLAVEAQLQDVSGLGAPGQLCIEGLVASVVCADEKVRYPRQRPSGAWPGR